MLPSFLSRGHPTAVESDRDVHAAVVRPLSWRERTKPAKPKGGTAPGHSSSLRDFNVLRTSFQESTVGRAADVETSRPTVRTTTLVDPRNS